MPLVQTTGRILPHEWMDIFSLGRPGLVALIKVSTSAKPDRLVSARSKV